MHRTRALVERIGRLNPTQERFFRDALTDLTEAERTDLEAYVAYCLHEGLTLDDVAQSYLLIVNDTLKEQVYFRRHRRYRYSTFSEVADSVYFNAGYMRQYMVGLALTTFFWANHRGLHRFFLESLPDQPRGRYLEVGPGHGFFFMSAMRTGCFDDYLGVDISETSVNLTRSILRSRLFGEFDRYEIRQCDFLALELDDSRRFDFLVMSEVLEHVEQPERFLAKLRQYATPRGRIFITTCVNAPAVDHIYLYRSQDHVRSQMTEVGLSIERELWLPYTGLSLDESFEQQLPVNLAMTLSCRS